VAELVQLRFESLPSEVGAVDIKTKDFSLSRGPSERPRRTIKVPPKSEFPARLGMSQGHLKLRHAVGAYAQPDLRNR
jgi:hypothetical protein